MRWQIGKIVAQCVCAALLMASVAARASAAETVEPDPKAKAASEMARITLARDLQMDVAQIEAIATDSQTWSDSSMGCGKPGSMAAQVITSGYAVTLKTPRGNYRVHVSNNNAIVCGLATQFRGLTRPGGRGVGLPLRNINQQIQVARADLAKKIGVPESEIVTETFVLSQWPDSTMECPLAGEQITKQLTKGYRIVLNHRGRVYTYNTDLTRVRACPAIEAD
jgi:hypothetical protein